MAREEFKVTAGNEWKRVIAALRHQARSIQDNLDDATEKQAKKSAKKIQAEALGLPARTGQHSGVRKRLARSVKVRRRGGQVEIESQMSNPSEQALAVGFDSPASGWSHEVFGRKPEVRQFPGDTDGWFRKPLGNDEVEFRDEWNDVLEDAADDIASAG